jgi:hypothetical protein
MSFLKSLDKKDAVEQISSTVNLRLTLDEDRLFTIASQNSGYSRNELTYLLLKRYIFDDTSLKIWLTNLMMVYMLVSILIVMS